MKNKLIQLLTSDGFKLALYLILSIILIGLVDSPENYLSLN